MSKRLILVLALAFVIGISAYAHAQVQNATLGGDFNTMALSRHGFNLTKPEQDISAIVAITRVRMDFDLTDDVMATMRLLNERVWGSSDETAANSDISLDLAYVTLKEFLYSPLTLMVGRQDFRLGSGLLIGDPDTNQICSAASTLTGQLGDLSARKAFDGIVGVLDYSPMTLTLGYLSMDEDTLTDNEDDDIVYLVNAAYDFGTMDTIGEVFYVLGNQEKNEVNNYGLRLLSSPIENLNTSVEYVYQTSKATVRADNNSSSNYALLLGADYTLKDVVWSPTIGVDYTRLTDNWNPMYEDVAPSDIVNVLLAASNCQVIGLTAIARPMEDVTAKLRYANVRVLTGLTASASGANTFAMNSDKKSIGNEFDLNVTYDYTEDVQLGLSLGYFDAGKAFNVRENASQVVGSMKVTF